MLKTIKKSSNRKLGHCAATYRSGNSSVFGSCPNSCPLKPEGQRGSEEVDLEYLQAVVDAVPEDGVSWTYTHFGVEQLPAPREGKTCINVSTDNFEDARAASEAGHPVVITVPASRDSKFENILGLGFVRCPAEYREEVTCSNCGGTGKPLCARQDRSYAIKFTAHGNQSKKVGTEQQGGCYGSSGPVLIQWRNTMQKVHEESDAEKLTKFVKTLPPGTLLRHHVVGDIG